MLDLVNYAGGSRTTGTFPNITAKNNSSGSVNDGTPFMAALVNELWGFYQACLDQAGLLPNGVNESATISQVLEALKNICGGPGEIVYYGGNYTMLAASNKRIIPLIGGCVLVTDYQELVDEVWDSTENATTEGFYKSTDTWGLNRSTSGQYLQLPNFRGVFIRGMDAGFHDPDTRDFYSLQESALKAHSHYLTNPGWSPGKYGVGDWYTNNNDGDYKHIRFTNTGTIADRAIASESPDTISDETRPVNRCLLICMRY